MDNIHKEDRPLVTFALFAYRQEKYIREAIEAALNQTYSPLEIILSDDCSPDGTFEIMRAMANAYPGPHKVRLNRNENNLGIGAHVNKLLDMAAGELIVLAAGDDISEIQRTEIMVDRWLLSGKKYDALWSSLTWIDEQGRVIGEHHSPVSTAPRYKQIADFVPCLLGCSHVTTKRLFNNFGKLRDDLEFEDGALGFRAIFSGGLASVDKKLVRYRLHPESVTDREEGGKGPTLQQAAGKIRKRAHREMVTYLGFLEDLPKIEFQLAKKERALVEETIRERIKKNKWELMIGSESFVQRLRGFMHLILMPSVPIKQRIQYMVVLASPRLWFSLAFKWRSSRTWLRSKLHN